MAVGAGGCSRDTYPGSGLCRGRCPFLQSLVRPPGGNPGANRWFLLSTPLQMPHLRSRICERLTQDLPSTRLQGGLHTYMGCLDTNVQCRDRSSPSNAPTRRAKCDPKAKMLFLQSFLRKGVSLGYVGRYYHLKDLKALPTPPLSPRHCLP